MPRFILYSRSYCHLCDDMLSALKQLAGDTVAVQVIDIDADGNEACVCTWQDRILLAKRAIEPRKGSWTLPAGYMELGETTEQAAQREALEEACATIEIDRLLAMYSVARIGQVQIMYRAKLVTPDIACGVESEEVALVDWADIPWDQLAFPTVVWALAHFHESRDKSDFSTYSNPTGDLARMWPPRKPAGV